MTIDRLRPRSALRAAVTAAYRRAEEACRPPLIEAAAGGNASLMSL